MQSCVRFLSGVRTVCRTVASCEPANRFSQIGSSMPAANRRFHSTAYNFSRTDYYHILGVSHAATGDEIKSAYRAKALKLHPDHNRSPSAKEEFAKLSEAYEVLSDAARRQQYNTSSNRSSTQYQYQHQSKSQGSNSNGFNQFHGFEDFRASDAEEFFRNAFREYNFERGFKPERGSHAEDDVYRQYVDDLYGDDADAFSFRERHYPYSARSRSTKRTASRRSRAPKADDFDDFDWDSEANVKVKVKVKAKRGSKTPTSSQTRPRARRGAVHSERETRESVFGKRFSKTANDNEVKENHANERSQIKVTVKLSFEQAVRGCTKEVLVETRASCSACNGSRNDPGLATKPCKPCQGSGVSRTKFGPFADRHTCFTCHGVGRVTQRCMRCYGRGFIANRNAVRVNVPAGVADGDAVRSTLRDGQEFSVVCRVAKSDHFVRDGFDVHSDAVVTLAQAALGGTVRVPGLLNHVTVIIPAGTQSHTKICLNGKGVPRLSTQGSGHHYVQIKIRPPTNLTDAQRALLLAFAYKEDRPADSTVEGVVNKEAGTRRTKKSVETSFSAKAESADVKFHDPLNGETLDKLNEFLENLKRGLKP